ncbi:MULTISPECIES: GNAT family N-acetyltransferase [Glaesserella]|uniref:GNAT family N-acetyltransferase n=1 Tax=Glaesserella australis TaxID=2094024 RepID=A0A328BW40_9PAST|nr:MULTISPECIES: GNAT family N-acetyltransferase [Glaesserella]AUI65971.1 GNAT family N-acetyltransferase [Glaesserella sp. 15-184]RAL18309.1 GNAT family N-acetyltransferase [Glaesserella australis]
MDIQLLDPSIHHRKYFDCGNPILNRFLQQTANQQAMKDTARTYVLVEPQQPTIILGFYTLTMTRLDVAELPEMLQKQAKFPLSAGLLARLAVDKKHQQKGYAKILLRDALKNLYQASRIVGFPIIVVDAKDGVADFYQKYGFMPIQQSPNRLYLMARTLETLL